MIETTGLYITVAGDDFQPMQVREPQQQVRHTSNEIDLRKKPVEMFFYYLIQLLLLLMKWFNKKL